MLYYLFVWSEFMASHWRMIKQILLGIMHNDNKEIFTGWLRKIERCANVKWGPNALFIICLASKNISFVTLRWKSGWVFSISISNAVETMFWRWSKSAPSKKQI